MLDKKNFLEAIQKFLLKHQQKSYTLDNKNYKLPLSDAIFCAQDTTRNEKFFQAIDQALQTKQNALIVDAGSGTGILAAFALFLGAKKAMLLEHNPESLKLSRELMRLLGLYNQCEFIEYDATKVTLTESYDLLISETLSSGFIYEDFPKIINNLRKYRKSDTIIIPESFEITVEQHDSNNTKLQEETYSISSYKEIKPQNIIQKKSTESFTFSTDTQLYKNIWIQSGTCSSFMNPQTINIELKLLNHWKLFSPSAHE